MYIAIIHQSVHVLVIVSMYFVVVVVPGVMVRLVTVVWSVEGSLCTDPAHCAMESVEHCGPAV